MHGRPWTTGDGRLGQMNGRQWEVGTDGRPARGERSRERTACGQPVVGSFWLPPNPRRCAWVSGQRSCRKPTHTGVGLVGPTGNPDLAGNSPLNLDIKTSLIRPSISPNLSVLILKCHRSGREHTQENWGDPNLTNLAGVGYENQDRPVWLVWLAIGASE
jgi:hypothetical protein